MGKIILIWNKLKQKIRREIYRPFLIIDGKRKVRELANKMDKDDIFVILPGLIGDFCYAMAYMHDFCLIMKSRGKTVSAFIPEQRKSMLSLYSYDFNPIFIQKNDKEYGRFSNILCQRKVIRNALLHNIIPTIPFMILTYDGNNTRNGFDILKNDLLKIGNNAKIEYPKVPKVPISSIQDFEKTKNRIIVLNPYSNSMGYMDITLYEEMARILRDKGYLIYTNVVGSQEPVKGTMALNCPIFELYNICNEIPLFISIRSGIVDFCVSAKCHFFVVSFGLRKNMTNDFYHTYEMKYWQTNNVTEFIHKSKDDTLNRFRNYVMGMKNYL